MTRACPKRNKLRNTTPTDTGNLTLWKNVGRTNDLAPEPSTISKLARPGAALRFKVVLHSKKIN